MILFQINPVEHEDLFLFEANTFVTKYFSSISGVYFNLVLFATLTKLSPIILVLCSIKELLLRKNNY